MTHRFILILFFFSALAGCGGGSDAKKSGTQNGDEQKVVTEVDTQNGDEQKVVTEVDTQNGDEQKAAAMAGYKLPNSIKVLEAEE
jgi:hypothetical protein